MSEKKRKRVDGDGGRSKKKKAVQNVAEEVKLSLLQDVGEWAPVIVAAPGIDPPTGISLKPYRKARAQNQIRLSGFKDELLLQGSASSKVDYVVQEEVTGAESLLKHYIGIYDPESGDLQLVPARNMVMRGVIRTEEEDEDVEQTPESAFQARVELGEAFGTKKSQKVIRSITQNRIAPQNGDMKQSSGESQLEATASAVIESMPEATSMLSRQDLQAAIDEAKPVPKANLEAKTPEEVYTLEELIGEDALKTVAVHQWIRTVEDKKGVETISRFVAKRVNKLVKDGKVKKLKALKFLLGLLQWYTCLKTGYKGEKRLPPRTEIHTAVTAFDSTVLDGLRRKFAPENTLNKWALDFFLTHICAIALIIDEFEMDLQDLREDLKLETKGIVQYFRELGCKVSAPTPKQLEKSKMSKAEGAVHRIAKLMLPLDFPKIRLPAKKNR